jgi:hypothetical protein
VIEVIFEAFASIPKWMWVAYCCGLPYVIYGLLDMHGITSRLGISINDWIEEAHREQKEEEVWAKIIGDEEDEN